MRVVEIRGAGGPEVLHLADQPKPQPGPEEAVIRVVAASVNRPDVQQRRGLYPPPPDASPIPGLDVAGIVEAVGTGVTNVAVGDAVCALANGGGYAEFCAVPAVQCMRVPAGSTFIEAAALPEAYFTAWNNVMWGGRLADGETLLVQGGTSGVGLAAIQIARLLRGATVYATAGSEEKRQICIETGADAAFDYRGDWDADILRRTQGKGVDVILDAQAGPYTQRQLDLLAFDGRLVFIASHQGETAEVNIRKIVRRRLSFSGSTIRPQPAAYKGRLARALVDEVWPLLEAGRIINRIHAVLPFADVREAHGVLDRNEQIGKVVLAVDAALAETAPHPASSPERCLMLTVERARDLEAHIGQVLGTSRWVTVSQGEIDDFARVSGDDHWIHVDVERARTAMPQGKTIAHGLYLLSLIPALQRDIYTITRRGRGLNYGYDRLRFIAPVPVESRVRLRQTLLGVVPHAVGTRLEFEEAIEIEDSEKAALIAQHILLIEDP